MTAKEKEALKALLKILCECPEIAERITITIKPNSKTDRAKPINKSAGVRAEATTLYTLIITDF